MEVMTFGKRSEIIKLAQQKIMTHPNRYVDHIYGEHEVGGTSWLYLAEVPFENIGFRTDLGIKPYPELTRSYLGAVPLVIALWPALLIGFRAFSKRRGGDVGTETMASENNLTSANHEDKEAKL
jgi:hypothetical protein